MNKSLIQRDNDCPQAIRKKILGRHVSRYIRLYCNTQFPPNVELNIKEKTNATGIKLQNNSAYATRKIA